VNNIFKQKLFGRKSIVREGMNILPNCLSPLEKEVLIVINTNTERHYGNVASLVKNIKDRFRYSVVVYKKTHVVRVKEETKNGIIKAFEEVISTPAKRSVADVFQLPKSRSQRIIFFLGDSNDEIDLKDELQLLYKKGVMVYIVGQQRNNDFWKDFRQLNDANRLPLIKPTISKHEIIISASWGQTVEFGKPLLLELTIMNNGSLSIPKGTILSFIGDEYFKRVEYEVPPIAKSVRTKMTVSVPAHSKNPLDIPNYLITTVESPGIDLVYTNDAFQLCSDIFIKDLISISPPLSKIPYFNILIFGVAGCGKSSFINSVLTVFSPITQHVVPVGGSSQHVTKELSRFSVSQVPGLENIRINFFDLWGMDENNYTDIKLQDFIRGNIPKDVTSSECLGEKKEVGIWNAFERRIHSVLFFILPAVIDNSKICESVSKNINICKFKCRMFPLVIIPRSRSIGDENEQMEHKQRLAQKFNLPAHFLYMFENYTDEKEKAMDIDRKTLNIMYQVLSDAEEYQTKNQVDLVDDVDYGSKIRRCTKCNRIIVNDECPCMSGVYSPRGSTSQITTQPSQNTSQLLCPKCNAPIESKYKKCPECKTPVNPSDNTPQNTSQLQCSKCKYSPIQPNFIKCPQCKTPVSASNSQPSNSTSSQNQKQALQNEIVKLKTQISEEKGEYELRVKALEGDIKNQDKALDLLDQKIRTHDMEKKKLEDSNRSLQSEKRQLDGRYNNLKQEIEKLEEEKKSLSNQFQNLQNTLYNMETSKNELRKAIGRFIKMEENPDPVPVPVIPRIVPITNFTLQPPAPFAGQNITFQCPRPQNLSISKITVNFGSKYLDIKDNSTKNQITLEFTVEAAGDYRLIFLNPASQTVAQATVKVVPRPIINVNLVKSKHIDESLFVLIRNFVTNLSDVKLSNNGIKVIVSAAITERVELFFDSIDPKKEIPLVAQRVGSGLSPMPITDPWGNLVILTITGYSQPTITFKTDVEKFKTDLLELFQNQ